MLKLGRYNCDISMHMHNNIIAQEINIEFVVDESLSISHDMIEFIVESLKFNIILYD